MMDNKIHNIGDSLVVTVIPKQKGTTTLKGFSDVLIGLVEDDRTVYREFRIVEDELFYGDWMELTTANISGKKVKQNAFIEIRYTRQGIDPSGVIEFQSIQFDGDFSEEVINSPILDRSIFSNIAWDEDTEILARNLFKKLYFRGIIPNYVLRGDNIDSSEDEDYITLFYAVAKFFAIIFKFFKRFENFYEDNELMLEWLRQNNIQIDESSISLEQMQFLANHLYDEIRKRGTQKIFKRQNEVVNDVRNEIDGEFIRLIRSKECDELIYDYTSLHSMGWCMRNSSPLYRGTCFAENLNKTRENTKDFVKLDNFQIFNTKNSSVTIEEVDSRRALLLKNMGSASCGLGRIDESVDVSDRLYVADPEMDYEITFIFKVNLPGNNAKLNFGVESFDANKRKFYDSMITPNDSVASDWFLNEISLDNFIEKKWYFVRGIIHAYSSDVTENVKLNIGYGNNLKFNNKFIKYLLPKIYLSSSNSASIYVWDYKIRPLVRGTNILPLKSGYEKSHSMGFIQAPRIFYSYFRNNNNSQSEREITDIIEKYLLPFNMTNIFQFINNENK